MDQYHESKIANLITILRIITKDDNNIHKSTYMNDKSFVDRNHITFAFLRACLSNLKDKIAFVRMKVINLHMTQTNLVPLVVNRTVVVMVKILYLK